MKRTNHPIFKEQSVRDADDLLLEQGVGNAFPDALDHLFGLGKKQQNEDEEQ